MFSFASTHLKTDSVSLASTNPSPATCCIALANPLLIADVSTVPKSLTFIE